MGNPRGVKRDVVALERRRFEAVKLFGKSLDNSEIGRRLKVTALRAGTKPDRVHLGSLQAPRTAQCLCEEPLGSGRRRRKIAQYLHSLQPWTPVTSLHSTMLGAHLLDVGMNIGILSSRVAPRRKTRDADVRLPPQKRAIRPEFRWPTFAHFVAQWLRTIWFMSLRRLGSSDSPPPE